MTYANDFLSGGDPDVKLNVTIHESDFFLALEKLISMAPSFKKSVFADLKNSGQDCWNHCNYIEGHCNWCGKDGLCCKKGWVGNECDGSIGGLNKHSCVLNPGNLINIFTGSGTLK